jgi:hypothetical protein
MSIRMGIRYMAGAILFYGATQSHWIPTQEFTLGHDLIARRQVLDMASINDTVVQQVRNLTCLANSGSSSCAHLGNPV